MRNRIWAICIHCKYYNFFRDSQGKPTDPGDEGFNIDFDGQVDCDFSKKYLQVENGIIIDCENKGELYG